MSNLISSFGSFSILIISNHIYSSCLANKSERYYCVIIFYLTDMARKYEEIKGKTCTGPYTHIGSHCNGWESVSQEACIQVSSFYSMFFFLTEISREYLGFSYHQLT